MVHFFGLLFRSWVGAENFPQVSSKETGFSEKLQSEISRQDRQVEAQQDNWEDLQKIWVDASLSWKL